jgi:hypothetical protein
MVTRLQKIDLQHSFQGGIMNMRNIIGIVAVTTGLSLSFTAQGIETKSDVQNRATDELNIYRNAKNEICETVNGRIQCLSERAYQKEQVMKERRARSHREVLHDRVD